MSTLTDSIPDRKSTLQSLASALFYEFESVAAIAHYFVPTHMDVRCKAREIMGDIARAILFSPFEMKINAFQNLPTPTSSKNCYVAVITPFSGHNLVLHTEYAKDNNLIAFSRAIVSLCSLQSTLHSGARYGSNSREIVIDTFNGGRELAELAWPMLLLTLCYREFVKMLDLAMRARTMESTFANELIHDSYISLSTLVAEGPDKADLKRLAHLKVVTRATLFEQMSQLVAVLEGIDIPHMLTELEKLAAKFASYCKPQ